MTFKHIRFYDSPVMRELERQAVKKGAFTTNSVEDIVKKASVKKSFVPTDDLQTDLLNLAAGLRERGFVKEADALENKVFIKKQAEVHLYRAIDEDAEDVINFAHPDGDAKVSDSQNQNGVVETILSTQKKMQDVANKQPTGKYAKLIDSVILATADILNVDLIKMAAGGNDDDEIEELLTGKKTNSINSANQNIKNNSEKISTLLNASIAEFDPENWKFKEADLLNPANTNLIAAYLKYSKVNSKDLAKWQQLSQSFGNLDNMLQNVYSYISNNARDPGLPAWADQIQKGLGKHFTGTLPSNKKPAITELANAKEQGILGKIFVPKPWITEAGIAAAREALVSPWFADNTESVFKFDFDGFKMTTEIDYQKMAQVARAISDAMINIHNNVLGQNQLEAASTSIANEAQVYFKGLQGAVDFYKGAPQLTTEATSLVEVSKRFSEMSDYLEKFTVGGVEGKKLSNLIQMAGLTDWSPKGFTASEESIKINNDIVNNLNKNALTAGDVLISDDTAANLFLTTAKMYRNVLPDIKDSKKAVKFKRYMMASARLHKLLKDNKGKPFSDIAAQVKKMYPKATSYEKLVQEAETWSKESADLTGQQPEQSEQNDVTASVRAKSISKKAAPPGEAAEPVAQSGKGGAGGGGASNTTKLMQDSMNAFAQHLEHSGGIDPNDLANIKGSGSDGVWGPKTTTALQTINKLFGKQYNVNLVDAKNPATAEKDAKNNYALLQILSTSYVRGGGGAPNKEFDTLSTPINWDDDVGSMSMLLDAPGNIKLMSSDMATLPALYDFLTRNNLRQPDTSGDSETNVGVNGFKPATWSKTISWFMKRSVAKYNAVKTTNKDAANSAAEYNQSARNLQEQLKRVVTSIASSGKKVDPQNVIPADYLKNLFSGGGSGGGSNNSSSYQQRGQEQRGQEQGRGQGRSQNMEGSQEDYGPEPNSTVAPFGTTINLENPWFRRSGLNWRALGTKPVIRLNDMYEPATQMAEVLFNAEQMDPKAAEEAVMTQLGFNPGTYMFDRSGQLLVAHYGPDGTGQWGYPPNGLEDAYHKTMSQLSNKSSLQKYQDFLNKLKVAIHDVMANWARSGAPPAQIEALSDRQNDWIQGINQQLKGIVDARRAGR